MHHRTIKNVMLAMALLLSASLSSAADRKSTVMGPVIGTDQAQPDHPKSKPAVKVRRVDVNSASKEALMKLPGIYEAEAEKIIANRPYLTKSGLVTKKALPMGVYQGIRKLVVAKQK